MSESRGAGEEAQKWRRELDRGLRASERGDHDAAVACFARAHRLAPTEAEPALALGREEYKRGNLIPAEALLRLALSRRPRWPAATAALAHVLIAGGRTDEAEQLLGTCRDAVPEHAALVCAFGELALERGRLDEAERCFVAALATGEVVGTAREGLSRVEAARAVELEKHGGDEAALFAWKRAADLAPNWATPALRLGRLLARLGRRGAARRRIEAALERQPGCGAAHFAMAELEREAGNLVAAARSLQGAMRADEPHPDARRVLAEVEAARGDLGRARSLILDEIEAKPDNAAAWATLGHLAAIDGDALAAEEAWRRAVALGDEPAREQLATLLQQTGRTAEAAALSGNFSAAPDTK
jgi:tetratricopeptide (TPR) repeat protein